jgi:hypothetical protein
MERLVTFIAKGTGEMWHVGLSCGHTQVRHMMPATANSTYQLWTYCGKCQKREPKWEARSVVRVDRWGAERVVGGFGDVGQAHR